MERTDRSFRHFVFSLVSFLIWCRITMNTLVRMILIHQGRRPVDPIAKIARDKVVILWKQQRPLVLDAESCSEGKI